MALTRGGVPVNRTVPVTTPAVAGSTDLPPERAGACWASSGSSEPAEASFFPPQPDRETARIRRPAATLTGRQDDQASRMRTVRLPAEPWCSYNCDGRSVHKRLNRRCGNSDRWSSLVGLPAKFRAARSGNMPDAIHPLARSTGDGIPRANPAGKLICRIRIPGRMCP